jgi:hypothetical protein
MYILFNYNYQDELEQVEAVVETYAILVGYLNAMTENNPALKWIQRVPENSRIGSKVPILHSNTNEFWIQRHEFAMLPTKTD